MDAISRIRKLFLQGLAFTTDGKYRKDTIQLLLGKNKESKLKKDILSYLKTDESTEKKGIRLFLENHDNIVFPYDFALSYSPEDVRVFRDASNAGRMFVMHNGKRMYVKKSFRFKFQVQSWYNSLRMEQDPDSPHRYLLEGRYPPKDCVVADLGGAEGMFTLDIIDSVKKVYIFEGDQDWKEALELTFAPYRDKVEIVSKYVGDRTDKNMVRLDDFFKEREIDYIKADIEGWEERMLEGASNILETKVSQVLCCVYHRKDSESSVANFLRTKGFSVSVNKNYMIFVYSNEVAGEPLMPPYLRHGVLHAGKGTTEI